MGKALYLIKNNGRLSGNQLYAEVGSQHHKQIIQAVQIKVKELLHVFILFSKVYDDIGFVFLFGKFFYNGRLTDTSGSFHHDSLLSLAVFFPLQQFIIDFSFENHNANLPSDEQWLNPIIKLEFRTYYRRVFDYAQVWKTYKL